MRRMRHSLIEQVPQRSWGRAAIYFLFGGLLVAASVLTIVILAYVVLVLLLLGVIAPLF